MLFLTCGNKGISLYFPFFRKIVYGCVYYLQTRRKKNLSNKEDE